MHSKTNLISFCDKYDCIKLLQQGCFNTLIRSLGISWFNTKIWHTYRQHIDVKNFWEAQKYAFETTKSYRLTWHVLMLLCFHINIVETNRCAQFSRLFMSKLQNLTFSDDVKMVGEAQHSTHSFIVMLKKIFKNNFCLLSDINHTSQIFHRSYFLPYGQISLKSMKGFLSYQRMYKMSQFQRQLWRQTQNYVYNQNFENVV